MECKNRLLKRIGQSTLEIAILFMVIAGVLILMRVYIKRSLASKIKGSADSISGGKAYHFDTLQNDHTVITSYKDQFEQNKGAGRVETRINSQTQNYSRNVTIDNVFKK